MASEKQVGASAGLLALLAFMVHMFMPPSSEVGNPAAALKPSAEGQSEAKRAAADAGKPVPVQGPWLASRQYFHREAPAYFRSPCLDFLLPPGKLKKADQESKTPCDPTAIEKLYGLSEDFEDVDLTTMIATIPDPLHTQLSLETDRDLDAIQEGAFDANWELATQWLPWTAKASQLSGDEKSAGGTPLDLENLPGLIVFRHHFSAKEDSNKLLFVFLAGETPTAGINGFQFDAARRSIERLQKQWKPVSVLGPSFSGSFMSLTKLIEGDLTKHPYSIQAGHVSNSKYAVTMLDQLASRQVTFHGNTIPTDSFKERFQELAKQQRFGNSQIGELVEDGSGYSFGIFDATSSNSSWQTYRYPRDIAQLRNAYSDRAFSAPAASGSAPAPAVPLLLKDAQSGESDFPIFSTSHTPVSQDAVVEQIVHTLKRDKVRLLSVSATNVFDDLFLVKLLAKECPDLRVVLNGADLLFAQEAADNSLSGTLALSSFPMFPEGTDWANGRHRATTFPDSDSVGEYNAMLALLGSKLESPFAFGPSFQEDPAFSSDWLLVLGRSGWAPVDLFRQDNPSITSKSAEPRWFDPRREPQLSVEAKPFPMPPPKAGWLILCLLTSGVSFMICGRFVYLRLRPTARSWSIFCSHDLPDPSGISSLAHARYLCLFACLASLIFLNGILLVPMIDHPAVSWQQRILLATALITLLWVGGFVASRMPGAKRLQPHTKKAARGSGGLSRRFKRRQIVATLRLYSGLYGMLCLRSALLLLPLIGILVWSWLCYQPGARGMFFRFRVLSLVLPISPIWPLVFGGAAFFVLSLLNLRRLTWAERRKPSLETSILGTALEEQMNKAEREIAGVLSGPAGTPFQERLAGAAASCLLIVLLVGLEQSFRSFESRIYELLFIALLLPVAILVIRSFTRFAFSWRFLRDLLAVLNSVDLYRFFGRLPDFDGSGPVWSRDLKVLSLATSVNSFIALHNVDLEMPSLVLKPLDYWDAWCKYDSPAPRARKEVLEQYRHFLSEGTRLSRELYRKVLVPFWSNQPIPLVQMSPSQVTRAPQAKAVAVSSSFTSLLLALARSSSQVSDDSYEMAAHYVTQQYSIFISYALRQIQNLLLCSVLAFVLLVLGLNSFCFQAPQLISYLTLVALVAGAVIVVTILAQIERHPLISRLCGTEEGALGKDFYIRILTYGALPVITVLGTQFPSLARQLGSWAEPALAALK